MYESVRKSFKRIMRERGIKKSDVAKVSNYSANTIYRFMGGRSDSTEIAKGIADALSVALIHHNGRDEIIENFKGV